MQSPHILTLEVRSVLRLESEDEGKSTIIYEQTLDYDVSINANEDT